MLKYFIKKYAPLSHRSSTATSRIAQNAVKDGRLNGYRASMFARVRILVFILSALSVLCGQSSAQEWRTVADGVEYAEVTREIGGLNVNMNLLRLDLRKVRLDVHHAMDAAIGTEETSSIATRHGAFAAINAGFFRLDTSPFAGDPAGVLMIDGQLLSEPLMDRIQLLVNNKRDRTETFIARTTLALSAKFGLGTVEINGIDRQRKQNEIVIYTPEFGRTTMTGDDGIEIVVARGKVASISLGVGNSVIPRGGFVLSASGTSRKALTYAAKTASPVSILRVWGGLPVQISMDRDVLDIVAGVPQILKNGRIDITWEQEKTTKSFVETRHPRTALAKLKDGRFLMITVDGRSESSGGIGLQDLAEYLLSLGAVDAMNLDGGGSTTMFLDGKVVNRPSDATGERKVSDALLVTLRKPAQKRKK